MKARFSFPDPFTRNHCAVIAWTHLLGRGAGYAQWLAGRATRQGLLNSRGSAPFKREAQWARLTGTTVKDQRYYRRAARIAPHTPVRLGNLTYVREFPTLAAFIRKHPRGRFIVATRNHYVAVINGEAFGYYGPRSRVRYFAEITTSPQES